MSEAPESLEVIDNETNVDEAAMNFELTMSEANLILAALQELPHRAVNALIQKIIQQGNSQLPE
jgi:hypothetical protein